MRERSSSLDKVRLIDVASFKNAMFEVRYGQVVARRLRFGKPVKMTGRIRRLF